MKFTLEPGGKLRSSQGIKNSLKNGKKDLARQKKENDMCKGPAQGLPGSCKE
jgi:hypothetical protein